MLLRINSRFPSFSIPSDSLYEPSLSEVGMTIKYELVGSNVDTSSIIIELQKCLIHTHTHAHVYIFTKVEMEFYSHTLISHNY